MSKRFVLVANDKSPSDAFSTLAKALSEHGAVVTGFLGGGKLTLSEVALNEAIEGADCVLVGMSSSSVLSEWERSAVAIARTRGVSYGFFSDAFGCYHREWFDSFRMDAAYLFIASEAEVADARTLFPRATIVVTGNPSWEGFENPNLTEDAIRTTLGAGEWDRIVLVPLNKMRPASLDIAKKCITWCSSSDEADSTLVVVAPHPGAVKQNVEEPEYYEEELRNFLATIPNGHLRRFIVLREKQMGIKSQDVLRVAQFVLSAQATTTDLQAAFLRIPVFNYLEHPETKERLMKEVGRMTAPLCDLKAALETEDGKSVFDSAVHQKVRSGQMGAFPYGAPPVGTAVHRMLAVLMK